MTAYPLGGTAPGSASPPLEAILSEGWWAPQSAPVPSPTVAADVLRQQAAALLQRIYRWLEATAPAVPQVLGVVPMLVTAVQLYEAQEYESCQTQVAAAVGVLRQVRATFPALPPL